MQDYQIAIKSCLMQPQHGFLCSSKRGTESALMSKMSFGEAMSLQPHIETSFVTYLYRQLGIAVEIACVYIKMASAL